MQAPIQVKKASGIFQHLLLAILLCFININNVKGNSTLSVQENFGIEKAENDIDLFVLSTDERSVFPAFAENKKIDHSEKYTHFWFFNKTSGIYIHKYLLIERTLLIKFPLFTSSRYYILFQNLRL